MIITSLNLISYLSPFIITYKQHIFTMVFSAPCFSNECGFCETCSDRNNEPAKATLEKEEREMRAVDLKKFMGKQLVEDEAQKYHIKMKDLMGKADYRNPQDIGYMRTRVNYEKGQPIENFRYNLIRKAHTEVCSDGRCGVFHHSAHEEMIKSYYCQLPIYQRQSGGHNLCAVCIQA